MRTVQETMLLSEVHPEFEPIVNPGSPMLAAWTSHTNIQDIRAAIAQMRQDAPKRDPAALAHVEEDIEIPVRDGLKVAARVYKPRAVPKGGCPGFIVFHGGGYMVGDLETEQWLCALFVQLGGIAVNVDYRHAPEHVFPAAINDAFDATQWVAHNVSSLEINPSKGLLVGGESSGADMALVISHLCRDTDMSPPLTGVYAPIPGGATLESIPNKYKEFYLSMAQNSRAPMLCAESVEFVRESYQADLSSPLAIPMAFPNHSGLPKTYFQVCGLDPVRDCGLLLEQVYKDDEVQTKLDIYPGLPHAFWAIFPDLEVSKAHGEDVKKALKWLLAK